LGAGIYNAAFGEAEIVNCTFSTNSVTGGVGGAGASGGGVADSGRDGRPGAALGRSFFNDGGIVRVQDTVLEEEEDNSPASTLQLRMLTDRVVLSWPASEEMVLQSARELSPTAAWEEVAETPTVADGVNSLLVPMTNSVRFYRLQRRTESD
jgi:hypothetical protein